MQAFSKFVRQQAPSPWQIRDYISQKITQPIMAMVQQKVGQVLANLGMLPVAMPIKEFNTLIDRQLASSPNYTKTKEGVAAYERLKLEAFKKNLEEWDRQEKIDEKEQPQLEKGKIPAVYDNVDAELKRQQMWGLNKAIVNVSIVPDYGHHEHIAKDVLSESLFNALPHLTAAISENLVHMKGIKLNLTAHI